jgi:hypothetical protein
MSDAEPSRAGSPVLAYETRPERVAVHGLTIVLLVCIGICVLSFSAMGVGYGLMADEWIKYGGGVAFSSTEARLCESLLFIAQIAIPLSMLILAICLLTWVHRANRKLRSFGDARLWYTPFRAVISWIIPYWAIIVPLYVMKEIYALSRGIARNTFTPLVGCWWAFWLLANFLYIVAITAGPQHSRGETDAQFAADYAIWFMLPAPFYVISGVLLMLVVWRVDRAMQRRQKGRERS